MQIVHYVVIRHASYCAPFVHKSKANLLEQKSQKLMQRKKIVAVQRDPKGRINVRKETKDDIDSLV